MGHWDEAESSQLPPQSAYAFSVPPTPSAQGRGDPEASAHHFGPSSAWHSVLPLGQPAEVQLGQDVCSARWEGVETRKRGVQVADAQIISVPGGQGGSCPATGNQHVGPWISLLSLLGGGTGGAITCFTGTSGCLVSDGAMGGPECGLSASFAVTQANDLTSVPQLLPVQNGD